MANLLVRQHAAGPSRIPVKADAVIEKGDIVMTLAGYAALGDEDPTGVTAGIALEAVDNTGGLDGAKTILVQAGKLGPFDNSSAGDAIVAADLYKTVFLVDKRTLAKTSSSGTRTSAGVLWKVDSTGVYIDVNPTGDGAEYGDTLVADTISEFTAAAGVTVDGVKLKDSEVYTDVIKEKTAAAGVTADGVLCKDGGIVLADGAAIEADIVNEATAAAGVTVDGVLLKDSQVTTDQINEKTAAAGVTIDGLQIKDSGLPVFMPSITKVQVISGTLVAGECVIGAGIVVTAASRALPMPSAVITGSTDFSSLAHITASNVVGGAGVGAITIQALKADGTKDADAAGTFHGLLYN